MSHHTHTNYPTTLPPQYTTAYNPIGAFPIHHDWHLPAVWPITSGTDTGSTLTETQQEHDPFIRDRWSPVGIFPKQPQVISPSTVCHMKALTKDNSALPSVELGGSAYRSRMRL